MACDIIGKLRLGDKNLAKSLGYNQAYFATGSHAQARRKDKKPLLVFLISSFLLNILGEDQVFLPR